MMAPTASMKAADRAEDRPRARIDEMVVVVRLGVGVGHLVVSPVLVRRAYQRSELRLVAPGLRVAATGCPSLAGKKVYDSVIVFEVLQLRLLVDRRVDDRTRPARPMLSPGFSVCSVKQKHWILLK